MGPVPILGYLTDSHGAKENFKTQKSRKTSHKTIFSKIQKDPQRSSKNLNDCKDLKGFQSME